MSYRQTPPRDMKTREVQFHFAERFRVKGREWAKADAEKEKLQALRGPTLEAIKLWHAKLPGNEKLSDAKLTSLAKADPKYMTHIEGEIAAVEKANLAWVERKAVEIELSESIDVNANVRTERKAS
jgi:hypothetical protein